MSAVLDPDARYTARRGRTLLTGTQALVLLTLLQHRSDAARGLDTAGFVSGYRGSPLASLDLEFERARPAVDAANVRLQSAVNEALAATAVWGTQNLHLDPEARIDGVYAMWYGKGAGLDQCVDVMRHANSAGTAPNGGVLAVVGDDHALKSSAQPHHCEPTFADIGMPVLYPATVRELLRYGLMGWSLSRTSGCWVGLKTLPETVNSTAQVDLEEFHPAGGVSAEPGRSGAVHLRWPDPWPAGERRFYAHKLPRILEFARKLEIDAPALSAGQPRLGIVTAGKSYLDVLEALRLLGLDPRAAAALGISVFKIGMPWPLEPVRSTAFCRAVEQVLVVEEKRPTIEAQLKQHLYDVEPELRPAIIGRRDEFGEPLFPAAGELTPEQIAEAICRRLPDRGRARQAGRRLDQHKEQRSGVPALPQASLRTPFFCSGCPHNSSTVIPAGSRAMAGIGCHGMAMLTPTRRTRTHTHMGGEGATWIGQAPYTNVRHVFQNLGEGTYFHSASLAIRAAVAANVNITYKILYNDAVAMTGGQPVDGELSVSRLSRQLLAEGVRRICVVAADEGRLKGYADLAPGTSLYPREALDRVQRELRDTPGVTVLIYDQQCATEKRRRIKRGRRPAAPERVFINDLICEACGDCNQHSNCLSVIPIETEFGRKRAIDQYACNEDLSCLRGFCPSFVTVRGGELRKPSIGMAAVLEGLDPGEPEPAQMPRDGPFNLLLSGVGGMGLVTAAAVIGRAAHAEGKYCSIHDRLGMAQKFGPVTSHVRIGSAGQADCAARIPPGSTDLLIAGDPLTSARAEVLETLAPQHTRVLFNSDCNNVGAFAGDPDLDFGVEDVRSQLAGFLANPALLATIPATTLAAAVCGDTIGANMFLLGYACQSGWLPLRLGSLLDAIEAHGIAAAQNRLVFGWGRVAAADPRRLAAAAAPHLPYYARTPQPQTPKQLIAHRERFLAAYQDRHYAQRYLSAVAAFRELENAAFPGRTALLESVARNYFKLLAYKDEYEVARLYASPEFADKLISQFCGNFRLQFHFAPPLLKWRDRHTGMPLKIRFGGWILPVLRLLAAARRIRGKWFDPFRWSADRRLDRRLIRSYEESMARVRHSLCADSYQAACELLSLPERIRGYGHIRARSAAAAETRRRELLDSLPVP